MLDDQNERAVIGGNNPPAYNLETHKELEEKVSEFLEATQVWLKLEKIESEAHAEQMTDQIDGLRGLWKKVDAQRKADKKPHDDAGTEVQAAFKPMLDKLTKAADKLKPKLATYATEQARIEQAKRDAEAEKARKEAEAAEKALAEAEAAGDIDALVEAETQAEEAKKAQVQAAKPVKSQVKSATGAGRTMSVRTQKQVTIDNPVQLFLALREEPEVLDVLQRIATRIVRAKDYAEREKLPGITITEQKVMA